MNKRFLARLQFKPTITQSVGITVSTQFITAVSVKKNKEQSVLQAHQQYERHLATPLAEQLAEVLSQFCTEPCAIHLQLPTSYYQIVQMDKPDLEPQEIMQSLPWTVKELVTINAENIIADYTDLPVENAGQKSKMFVFAADKSQLMPLIDVINNTENKLASLSCKEMALLDMNPDDNFSRLIVLQEQGEEPSLFIVKQQQLMLTRRLRGFMALNEHQDTSTVEQLTDSLSLEIQRSIDFYESQLKQPPIRSIKLCTDFVAQEQIIARLAAFQSAPVNALDSAISLGETLPVQYQFALASAYKAVNA